MKKYDPPTGTAEATITCMGIVERNASSHTYYGIARAAHEQNKKLEFDLDTDLTLSVKLDPRWIKLNTSK